MRNRINYTPEKVESIVISRRNSGGHLLIEEEDFYLSPPDFYRSTPTLFYTDIEREFVDVVYQNASTVDVQQQLLRSLRTLKENAVSFGDHERSNFQNSSRIKQFLQGLGFEVFGRLIKDLEKSVLKTRE